TPKVLVTLLGLVLMMVFLMPLGYMLTTAFKQDSQSAAQHAPLWPAQAVTYTYHGPDIVQSNLVSGQTLQLYNVPTSDGIKQYGSGKRYREDSIFMDPANPENGVFVWTGRYRTLDPVYQFSLTLDNFQMASDLVNFPLLYRNSLVIALLSTIGTLLSCILVAY